MVVDIIFDASRKDFFSGGKADEHGHSHHHGHDHGDADAHSHEDQHEHRGHCDEDHQTNPSNTTTDEAPAKKSDPSTETASQQINDVHPSRNSEETGDSTDADPDSFPIPPPNVVAHKGGFTRKRIEGVFNDAGLRNFDWNIVGDFEPLHGKTMVQLFCAIGTSLVSNT